ncbi:hypothetical protein WA158_007410 [Blastocystis sp. Blastoise]
MKAITPKDLLSEQDLHSLDTYEYHSGTYTPFDNFMSPYYGKLAELLPMWLAPNTVTIIGLLFSISAAACVVYYDPQFTGSAPSWVYIWSSIANTLYMVLDCLDGKQARRLHASSPLGQMFDHGCDSLNLNFILFLNLSTCGLGQSFLAPLMFSFCMTLFAAAQLCEYYSGILHCGSSILGVTELLIYVSALYMYVGIFGRSIIDYPVNQYFTWIPVPITSTITLSAVVFLILIFAFVIIFFSILFDDLKHGSHLPPHLSGNKNNSRIDYILRILSLFELTICSLYVLSSKYMITDTTACLFLSGFSFSLFSTRSNIFHLTRKYMSPFYFGCIPLTLFSLLLFFHYDTTQYLYICVTLIVCLYLAFVCGAVKLIKEHLHIRVFHLTPKEE